MKEQTLRDADLLPHLGLVQQAASRYRHVPIPREDLLAHGNFGLISAVRSHYGKPDFVSLAQTAIRDAMSRHVFDEVKRCSLLSPGDKSRLRHWYSALDRITGNLTRTPPSSELARILHWTPDQFRNLRRAIGQFKAAAKAEGPAASVRLSQPDRLYAPDPRLEGLIESDLPVSEALGRIGLKLKDEVPGADRPLRALMHDGIDKLDSRSRKIVRLIYGEGLSIREAASRLGISEHYVISLHSGLRRQLKAHFLETLGPIEKSVSLHPTTSADALLSAPLFQPFTTKAATLIELALEKGWRFPPSMFPRKHTMLPQRVVDAVNVVFDEALRQGYRIDFQRDRIWTLIRKNRREDNLRAATRKYVENHRAFEANLKRKRRRRVQLSRALSISLQKVDAAKRRQELIETAEDMGWILPKIILSGFSREVLSSRVRLLQLEAKRLGHGLDINRHWNRIHRFRTEERLLENFRNFVRRENARDKGNLP